MQTLQIKLDWPGPIYSSELGKNGRPILAKKQFLKGRVLSELAPNSTAHHMKKHRLSQQFKAEIRPDIEKALKTLPQGFKFSAPVRVEITRAYSGYSKEFDSDAIKATLKPLYDLLGELLFDKSNGRGDSSKYMQMSEPTQLQLKGKNNEHYLLIIISDISSENSTEISFNEAVKLMQRAVKVA